MEGWGQVKETTTKPGGEGSACVCGGMCVWGKAGRCGVPVVGESQGGVVGKMVVNARQVRICKAVRSRPRARTRLCARHRAARQRLEGAQRVAR